MRVLSFQLVCMLMRLRQFGICGKSIKKSNS